LAAASQRLAAETGIVRRFRSFSRSSTEIRFILNDTGLGGSQTAALPSFLSAFMSNYSTSFKNRPTLLKPKEANKNDNGSVSVQCKIEGTKKEITSCYKGSYL
jgi:hypothetical protein